MMPVSVRATGIDHFKEHIASFEKAGVDGLAESSERGFATGA
jgi:hypothetical protein